MSTQGAAYRTGAERQGSTFEKFGPSVSVAQYQAGAGPMAASYNLKP